MYLHCITQQNALSQQKTPGKNLSQLEKQKIEQEIKKTDNEIDELVYKLYGITARLQVNS